MDQEYRQPADDRPADDQPADEPVEAGPGGAEPAGLEPAGTADDLAPACGGGCGCASREARGGREPAPPSYVYALGRIDFRFPSLGVEKEIAQNAGRAATKGMTDREAVHHLLSQPENRYLARQLCWVLSIQGIETYLLRPRDPVELGLLVDAVRTEPGAADLDVVIGIRGGLAPPGLCGGLTLPVVAYDQIYSFDGEELVRALKRPAKTDAAEFARSSRDLLRRIMQMGDNAGDTDEHRALNYVAVRNPRIYQRTVKAHAKGSALSSVEFRDSRLSATRKIVDIVLSYTGRRTDVTEKYFTRVDVTEEFPFTVTALSPYYDR
ncbi:hypothetical protein [Streptomyces sp. CB03911]|uniref:cyanobactin maturation protease PatG family protein n=1 Tax=Streptomyces sp. CB03911 TaxID=1804758 RepID=UPI000A7818C1|nr:hypothetical protein [Streptomyces sp. CB03911]